MQFTCNVHETAETITAKMMDEIFTVTAADTCGAADQSEDNAVMDTDFTPDELRAARRVYAKKHPRRPKTEKERERMRQYMRQYRAKHRDRINERQRQWHKEHPEKAGQYMRSFWQRRAAELRQQSDTDNTTAEV